MKTVMEGIQDLIEEAKLRTVWWIICIFAVTYFLTHTSKSMLMNIPIAVLMVSGTRILLNEVEFRWKVRNARPASYLSHLQKKQLSVNDSRLEAPPSSQKWKRKIDSPVVEAAIEDFLNKILHDFVIDLWYSDITPDKDAPELIRAIVMDALGEVSGRIKEVNLVDLLTRDVVDLIGDHIDLFRRNQAAIGRDVMRTLSSEERDERLKYHLLASKELHPALISPECEYKVLQRLMDGLLAAVLRPREAQCPLVRCMARELVTCLVLQPVMDFASPEYINELIEYIIIAFNNEGFMDVFTNQSPNDHTVPEQHGQSSKSNLNKSSVSSDQADLPASQFDQQRHADWAKAFEAASQRRTEVLTPENLENMWAIGRNYKKRLQRGIVDSDSAPLPRSDLMIEAPAHKPEQRSEQRPEQDTRSNDLINDAFSRSEDLNKETFSKGGSTTHEPENTVIVVSNENGNRLRRSSSASDLKDQLNIENNFTSKVTAPIINEYYCADGNKLNTHSMKSDSDASRSGGLHVPKLSCRVIGAYFEKLGSNSFAVYLIAVTDAENNTWFVKRRYSNFERLHRHLKDIPNYTLHLPPKRIFSSSIEDAFVHQRCIQLDKYLQDLLSIANVAEQHEVWDFVSASSKNYSFGKSSSAMTTLAVNVDDAVDDIVRQFKGVSDGLMRVVVGPPSSCHDPASPIASKNLSLNVDDINKLALSQSTSESLNDNLDNEEGDKDSNNGRSEVVSAAQANEWHSENELDSKELHMSVAKHGEDVVSMHSSRAKSENLEPTLALLSVSQGDPAGVPPEWTPPNLSVPILNLVDNVFQLNRRGWLRRQVFWISKQILQLVMEDAIDDWLLSQIQWVRQEEVIAQGIRWVQNILWPNGIFFRRLRIQDQRSNLQTNPSSEQATIQPCHQRPTQPGSFEQQLEAARRASDVKNFIFNGAPATLASLIGHKQYRRCARDIYYFLQSTVCLKQLGYGILELVLISIFPELGDLVKDIHEKTHNQHA